MPIGLYRVVQSSVRKGDLVEICLPKSTAETGLLRNYLGGGSCASGAEPLIKQVVGVHGDMVDVQQNGIFVNGNLLAHSETLLKDTQGRNLAAVPRGQYLLKKDEIWVYGNHNYKSWDSRYFGAVMMTNVKAVLTPFLIFD
jgi:conjugative transfer signal peptidase TraF